VRISSGSSPERGSKNGCRSRDRDCRGQTGAGVAGRCGHHCPSDPALSATGTYSWAPSENGSGQSSPPWPSPSPSGLPDTRAEHDGASAINDADHAQARLVQVKVKPALPDFDVEIRNYGDRAIIGPAVTHAWWFAHGKMSRLVRQFLTRI